MESELGERTRGVWTTAGARAAGVSAGVARQRVREGAWQTVHRGVHADGGVVLDPAQRGIAACLAAGPTSVASRRTAARLWRLPLVDDDDPATGRGEHVHDDVATLRQSRERELLHPARLDLRPDEVVVLGGCRTTTALRTVWDLAAVLRPDALVCVLDDGLRRRLVTREQLLAEADRRVGRPGSAAFRTAVERADGRAESPMESLGRLLLQPVVPLVPQVEVRTRGITARLDLADEKCLFGVEADGRAGHAGDLMVRRDRDRERALTTQGWVLERFGWYDVRCPPDRLRARVLHAWRRQCQARGEPV